MIHKHFKIFEECALMEFFSVIKSSQLSGNILDNSYSRRREL
jgi:hypothetical protein